MNDTFAACVVIFILAWLLLRRSNSQEVDRIRRETNQPEFATPIRPTPNALAMTGCMTVVMLAAIGGVVIVAWPWLAQFAHPGGDVVLLAAAAGIVACLFGVLVLTESTPNYEAQHPADAREGNLAWGGWFLLMAALMAAALLMMRTQ